MVGYNADEKKVPWFVISLAGGASGILTRAVTQPLDVVKIRLQVQDTDWSARKYKGTISTMRKMALEEGVSALWKGHTPAQVLSLTYGLVQFTGFDLLSQLTHPIFSVSPFLQPLQHFICGSLAGVLATLLSYPFDVVRTRYIIQGNPPVYTAMHQTFKIIISKESLKGLYRGLVPTFVQIAPNTGFQFTFYHLASQLWDYSNQTFVTPTSYIPNKMSKTSSISTQMTTTQENSSQQQISENSDNSSFAQTSSITPTLTQSITQSLIQPSSHPSITKSLFCGSIAGLGAKTIVYPLDFTKKRLQAQGLHTYTSTIVGKPHSYKGAIDCLVTVIRNEGVMAVYKGFVPSSVKAVATSALVFASYERFKRLFAEFNRSRS